ncbi:hypothetical protein JMN32_00425 [Fulvivirga sp. 29W222]|uniref:Uncharacterized protein n=1 Tax=Fulvivirga marina TaxID=2494733 RepID=A0A937KC16_9BACT|nr:hypothetical protein [Fulvivirga marina]MBL6444753.1 hypothetical protein [Fulvivirga marina]
MRKFLINLLLFFVPLIVIYISLEVINRKIPNEYSAKIKNFEDEINNIEVLVFGSSHALRAVNPEFIDYYTYNMAMVSQTLQLDYAVFEKYKEELKNLKVLVLTISHFTLSTGLNEGEIANRISYYHHFYGLPLISRLKVDNYSVLPAIGYKRATWGFLNYFLKFKVSNVKTNKYGFMGEGGFLAKDSISFVKVGKEAANRHEDHSYDFNENIKLLKKMIDWSKKHNIKVVLIEVPKTNEYERNLDQDKAALIDSTLDILQKSNSNVSYFDFTNHYKNKSFFRNADHLNEAGAREFSLLLNTKISEFIKE